MTRPIQPNEILKQLTSPGCFLPPPHVLHPERIPPAIQQAQIATRQRWFPPRPVRLSLLEDVYVAAEGLVFTTTLDVVDVTIREHTQTDIERSRLDIVHNRARLAANRLLGTFLLCRKPGARNYGHWLTEMLPKAWLAREHLPGPFNIMIQALDPPLRDVMLDTLARLGFQLSQVFGFDQQPFRVDRLLVVDGLTEHGTYMSPLVADCLQDLAGPIPPARHDRLLITRGPGATRRFADAPNLVQTAAAAGFTAVDPGTLPFADQVALFKGARKVAGAMGSGLANLGFALPGTDVCVAAPATMPDTFFWFLSGLRGLRYTEIRCASDADDRDGEVMLDHDAQATLLAEPAPGTHPPDAETEAASRALDALFDASHYLAQRGPGLSGADALLDYCQTGWRMGLNPSPRFGTDAYLLANADVLRAGMNPLEHYVRYGLREGRTAPPVAPGPAPHAHRVT